MQRSWSGVYRIWGSKNTGTAFPSECMKTPCVPKIYPRNGQNLPTKWSLPKRKSYSCAMHQRYIAGPVTEALKDTPVVLINGARQTGKSTLCRQLVEEGDFDGRFTTMDDPTILA